MPILVKSIKKCDRESARRRTDRQTRTYTHANRFYNLSHAICYSYGTDNKEKPIKFWEWHRCRFHRTLTSRFRPVPRMPSFRLMLLGVLAVTWVAGLFIDVCSGGALWWMLARLIGCWQKPWRRLFLGVYTLWAKPGCCCCPVWQSVCRVTAALHSRLLYVVYRM